jgi:soluble lytic murein transglycosylase-like protein
MAAKTFISATVAAIACALAQSAAAQVLEIGDDGGVTTYAGPAVYSTDGVSPIAPASPPLSAATPAQVREAIAQSAARHAVSPALVEAVAWQESRFNQAAVSQKGARGVMQLMPGTASDLGVDAGDLRSNVEGGAAYLAQQMRRFGDVRLALAAYNAGPEAVVRWGGVPPYAETRNYVRAILSRLGAAE